MDDLIFAVQEAHTAQTGASGSLRIGYLEWSKVAFLDTVQSFIQENPQFAVEIYRRKFPELREDIMMGRLDVIFTAAYDCVQLSESDFNLLPVREVPMMAYMSWQNPLSKLEILRMEDLQGEPILMVDTKSSTGYGAFISDLFIKHNIKPLVAQYAHDGGEHIGSVLINKGILLASQYFLENSFEKDICRIPIEGEKTSITAVWKKGNNNLVLQRFLEQVRRDMKEPFSSF